MEFLRGERVGLHPLAREDLALIRQWSNDPELRGLIGSVTPLGESDDEKFIEKVYNSEDRIWFSVWSLEEKKIVGEAGLLRMFPAWRTTDMTIIIGDRDARGKGYGLETARLLLNYAFGYLNFHRVAIGVVGFNTKALKFWERAGFKQEGIQRDGYYYNHHYHDFIMMSILEEEYRERYGK